MSDLTMQAARRVDDRTNSAGVDRPTQVQMAALEARLRVRAGLELAFPDLALPPFQVRRL